MLCEECKKNQATVHITRVTNGEKKEYHLCEECARRHQQEWWWGMVPNFSIPQFLAGMLQQEWGGNQLHPKTGSQLRCEQCGFRYDQFAQSGRLGCDRCYDYFCEELKPLLRRIHGEVQHNGKVPRRSGGKLYLEREISNLRRELEELIQKEEFEQAAKLRDQIREAEKRLAAQGGEAK